MSHLVERSHDYPNAQRFGRRIQRIHQIVLCMARIYYNDILRIHIQIIREKDTGEEWRNPCESFLMFLLSHEDLQRAYFSSSNKNAATYVPQLHSWKPIRDSAAKVFAGVWSHRHPLSSRCQNSESQGKAGVHHKPYVHH